MGWEAWVNLGVVALVIVALARNVAGPDLVLFTGAAVLVLLGLFSPDKLPTAEQAVRGFGNEGLVTVAVLFVVVAGLSQTGAMALLVQPLLGRPRSVLSAQARLMPPVMALSAFLNNTPIVAMFMPVVSDWCKKSGLAASKLFIPLSYAAILGGTCSLIGTSTNLVVNGLLISDGLSHGLGLFEIAKVGLPCAAVGLVYILVMSRWLLPDRKPALSDSDDLRRYTVEMLVEPGSALSGKTIEQAGLRHLPGLYLAEIDRGGQVIAAVSSSEMLQGGDRLVFVGVIESVVDLQKIRGLTPATDQVFKLSDRRADRCLIEAVVSDTCPLVGKTIREGRFRSVYNAAVIAAARRGQRIGGKIGDIVLRGGDTLLLEAHPSLADRLRNSRDFFLVSKVEGSAPPRHAHAPAALLILAVMVVLVTAGVMSILAGAMLAAVAMVLARCCSADDARRSIDWQVLIVIGSAFALGKSLESSGAAATIARTLIDLGCGHPWVALLVVYAVTMLFTELITNNAAAILVYPIALATAKSLGVSHMPFVMCVMMAASASFSTPIGYQTNMMVFGPGGYRFSDYLRIGLPLNLLMLTLTVLLAPWFWPFAP